MARLPYATQAELTELIRRSGLPENTPPSNAFRMLAHVPALGAQILRLVLTLLTTTDLDSRLRELVILRVAQRCRGEYVWAQHQAIAHSVGVSHAQVEALERGEVTLGLFDHGECAALAFADELVDACCSRNETLTAVRQMFSTRQVVELQILIGYFRMICSLMTTLDVEAESPFGLKILKIVSNATQVKTTA